MSRETTSDDQISSESTSSGLTDRSRSTRSSEESRLESSNASDGSNAIKGNGIEGSKDRHQVAIKEAGELDSLPNAELHNVHSFRSWAIQEMLERPEIAITNLSSAIQGGLGTADLAYAHYLRGLALLRLGETKTGLEDLGVSCELRYRKACEFFSQIQ